MRLLQRVILADLLRVFGFLLAVLTVLLVFVGVVREASERGLGAEQIVRILPFVVPSLMPFTIPATLLLSVCVVYGRMAGDQEVTAAKAAGIHVLSLLAPAFLLGAVLSVTSFLLTDRVIPWATGHIQAIVADAVEDLFLDMLRSQHRVSDPQRGISVQVERVDGRRLVKPLFRYAPPGRRPVVIAARTAELQFDLANREVWLELDRAQITDGRVTVEIPHERRAFPLGGDLEKRKARHLPIDAIRTRMAELAGEMAAARRDRLLRDTLALSVGDLPEVGRGARVEAAERRGKQIDRCKLHTEMHSRAAMAAGCFFFVLVGGPFSIRQAKAQFLTSFLICFVPILLVYYPLTLGMLNLAKHGSVDPTWAVWVANGLMLAWGLALLRGVLRS